MPGIVETTLAQRRAVDARNNATSEDMARAWFAVEQTLEPQITALAEESTRARAEGRLVNRDTLERSERYTRLLAQMAPTIRNYDQWAAGQIEGLQRDLAALGLDHSRELLELAGYNLDALATFNPLAFESIILAAREGQPLMALLDRGYGLAAEAMADKLIAGVALGINPRVLARQMMREGLAQSLDHALLLSRDQGIRAWRNASMTQYQQNGIAKYRRTAARQARTCIACLALDGTIHDSSELFPNHPQCRCIMIPIVEGARPIDLPPAADWLASRSPAEQQDILGPHYDLYKSGKPLQSMVGYTTDPVWGKNTRVRSVKSLR